MNLLVPFETYGTLACFEGGYCRGDTYEFYEELFSNSDVVLIKVGLDLPTISPLARQEYNNYLKAWNVTAPLFRHTKTMVFPNEEKAKVYVKIDDEA